MDGTPRQPSNVVGGDVVVMWWSAVEEQGCGCGEGWNENVVLQEQTGLENGTEGTTKSQGRYAGTGWKTGCCVLSRGGKMTATVWVWVRVEGGEGLWASGCSAEQEKKRPTQRKEFASCSHNGKQLEQKKKGSRLRTLCLFDHARFVTTYHLDQECHTLLLDWIRVL